MMYHISHLAHEYNISIFHIYLAYIHEFSQPPPHRIVDSADKRHLASPRTPQGNAFPSPQNRVSLGSRGDSFYEYLLKEKVFSETVEPYLMRIMSGAQVSIITCDSTCAQGSFTQKAMVIFQAPRDGTDLVVVCGARVDLDH